MSTVDQDTGARERMQQLAIYQSYMRSRYLSFKHSSYFQVYEELLGRYRGRPVVFMEIGVLNGGSLFMWRDYFGPAARIIGVDLNPLARRWEQDGFEIHIGSQSDPDFWQRLFAAVGDVDVILDDGGHTNEQQIITAAECLPHIRDGGMLIVEDTHASYIREFGNPSRYSFLSWCKALVDGINARFPGLHAGRMQLSRLVWSTSFFESIVCFHVDRTRCFVSWQTSNNGESFNAQDYRHHQSKVAMVDTAVNSLAGAMPWARRVLAKPFSALKFLMMKWQSRRLRQYFH